MQPTEPSGLRLLFLAQMDRLNACIREFGAEVQRQEDSLRALYPWLAKAFCGDATPAAGANDNGPTKH